MTRRGLSQGSHHIMLLLGITILAQHRLDAPEESGRLSKGLPLTSSSIKLQRVSPERASVRHWLRDAEQSLGIAVRRTVLSDQIGGIVLDPSLSQVVPSQCHSSTGCAKGTEGLASEGGARKEVTAAPELQDG